MLLTTGADLDLGPVPPNVTVERWVPQTRRARRARLVVCHGGSGTVLGTLAAGLPLIILPLFADQATNAERARERGRRPRRHTPTSCAPRSSIRRRRRSTSRASCAKRRRRSPRFRGRGEGIG